jgi:hypothetical protein
MGPASKIFLTFFLEKKSYKKFKAGRFLRSSPLFQENLSKKTKVFAEICSEKEVHPDSTSRPANPYARLRYDYSI